MSDTLIDVTADAGQSEGTAAVMQQWLKKCGEQVAANEPIAEIETDKVVVEISAPSAGTLHEILIEAGQAVDPGQIVARLAPSGKPVVAVSARADAGVPPRSLPASRKLSPAVRRLVREHAVDPASVKGTGRGGRITVKDVEALLVSPETASSAVSVPQDSQQSYRVPHDPMRRRIAQHMVRSLLHTAPHVTSVFEVDMSAVVAHRRETRQQFASQGVQLTYTAYFLLACVRALQAVPQVNARFHEDSLEIFNDINIGVGTALEDKGLIVPVMRQAQSMSLLGIARELQAITLAARSGKLAPEQVRGGTFTLSNHGVSGSLLAAPIVINQPQVAILGVGKLEKRVYATEVDGRDVIGIRPMCYVTLSVDHRALDAFVTNRFLSVVSETLQDWS